MRTLLKTALPWHRALVGIVTFAATAVFAAIVVPWGVVAPRSVEHLVLSPAFLPYVLSGLIGLFAAIHALISLRSPELADITKEDDAHPRWLARLCILSVLLGGYWALPETFGMLATAVAITGGLLWLGGERRPAVFLGVALLLPVAIYLFFVTVAQVPLPTGELFE
ncbi:MAG: tripartite tricarboxylate transporter TctB family protein [Kiloniellales bacterium]